MELGVYQIRVATPMLHNATIDFAGERIANTFELTKTTHAANDGQELIHVTLTRYFDQWINDSSPTW